MRNSYFLRGRSHDDAAPARRDSLPLRGSTAISAARALCCACLLASCAHTPSVSAHKLLQHPRAEHAPLVAQHAERPPRQADAHTSTRRQLSPGHVSTVTAGDASVLQQLPHEHTEHVEASAAFHVHMHAAAGSGARALLHGTHRLGAAAKCHRCAIVHCNSWECTGHCKMAGERGPTLFACRRALILQAQAGPPDAPPYEPPPPPEETPCGGDADCTGLGGVCEEGVCICYHDTFDGFFREACYPDPYGVVAGDVVFGFTEAEVPLDGYDQEGDPASAELEGVPQEPALTRARSGDIDEGGGGVDASEGGYDGSVEEMESAAGGRYGAEVDAGADGYDDVGGLRTRFEGEAAR